MEEIKRHYQRLYHEHGDSPKAVQYADRETHYRRFEALCGISDSISSVADFGCGLADLLSYLTTERGFEGPYLGLDFVPEFVERNRQRFAGRPDTEFRVFDLTADMPDFKADYGILNGVFNNLMEDNRGFMFKSIRKMFSCCNEGLAFNAMSTYVDYQDPGLYYADPLEVFHFCKTEITPKVVLRHDYQVRPGVIPFEFCIYLYR